MEYNELTAKISQVVADPGLDLEEWLAAPTEYACRFCGQENLERWEALNNRCCRRCLAAYEKAAGDPPPCSCRLPPGARRSDAFHVGPDDRVLTIDGGGPWRCPDWMQWWRLEQQPKLARRRLAAKERTRRGGKGVADGL